MACSPISTCAESVVHLRSSSICTFISNGPSTNSSCYCLFSGPNTKYTNLSVSNTTSASPTPAIGCHEFQAGCFRSSRQSGKFQSVTVKESTIDVGKQKRQYSEVSCAGQSLKIRLLLPKKGTFQEFKCISWPPGRVSDGLAFGLSICYSSSEPVNAKAAGGNEDECESSHGKRVYTDYSVIGEWQIYTLIIHTQNWSQST